MTVGRCFDGRYFSFSILSGENGDFRQADVLSFRLDSGNDKFQPRDFFRPECDFFCCRSIVGQRADVYRAAVTEGQRAGSNLVGVCVGSVKKPDAVDNLCFIPAQLQRRRGFFAVGRLLG